MLVKQTQIFIVKKNSIISIFFAEQSDFIFGMMEIFFSFFADKLHNR